MKTNEQIKKQADWNWKKAIGWGAVALVAAIGIPASPLLFEPYDAVKGWLPQTQNAIDPEKAGQFGDFVGGFIGTIAFIVSVFVLYVSYKNQKETNQQMLADQDKLHKRTTFELRFFELLKFHRENVGEIEVKGKTGRTVFVSLIREFRLSLDVVQSVRKSGQLARNAAQELDLAYLAFYYGVGPNSTRLLQNATSHLASDLTDHVIHDLALIQKTFRDRKLGLSNEQNIPNKKFFEWAKERLGYPPFDGHQSRLGHYYRHLWQMMKYVDGHSPQGTAKEYAGIVRAQLSNHEQALLCLNALSSIGAAWDGEHGLLSKYELIKNIPKSYFDSETELDLKHIFPDIIFEYEESTPAEPNRSVRAPED